MSYDIELKDPVTHETLLCEVAHFMRGGTYAVGGTREMWVNITWNYAPIYYRPDVFGEKGIRTIYGMSGASSIPILKSAMAALKDDVSGDYWECNEGNAKQALAILLAYAQMRPDGVWDGD